MGSTRSIKAHFTESNKMKSTDLPALVGTPFGENGIKTPISQNTSPGTNAASYNDGFPAITMTELNNGGLPPRGSDFNQILYELAKSVQWSGTGALYKFSSDFATKIGGYPKGSKVIGSDGDVHECLIDDNMNDPVGGAGWINKREDKNTRELWRRSLAEAGFTLVPGSFEEGLTITDKKQAGWHISGGQCFAWDGDLSEPKVVPAGSTPMSSGGIGQGKWVGVGDASLRQDISLLKWSANSVARNGVTYFYKNGGRGCYLTPRMDGAVMGITPDDKFVAASDVDLADFRNDISMAIKIADGNKILVDDNFVVRAPLENSSINVHFAGTGKLTLESDFLTNYSGNFLSDGITINSENAHYVIQYKEDANVDYLKIQGGELAGGVRFIYQSSLKLNPEINKHGCDTVIINQVRVRSATATLFNFDNMPYRIFAVSKFDVENFTRILISTAISNWHPFYAEMQLAQVAFFFNDNDVRFTDDWWTTPLGQPYTYGAVLLHEGKYLQYANNRIAGIKARRLNTGASHSAAYWLYCAGITSDVYDNDVKNVFAFGSKDPQNVFFKQKKAKNLYVRDNKFYYDNDWLSRIGESIDPVNDLQIIHDVEPGHVFDDIEYKNNTIELIANGYPVFSNSPQYKFNGNTVRQSKATNLSTLSVQLPVIGLGAGASSNIDVEYYKNKFIFPGGIIAGPYLRNDGVLNINGTYDANENYYECDTLTQVSRARDAGAVVIGASDNTMIVTRHSGMFSNQGINSPSGVVKSLRNTVYSAPGVLAAQQGFGMMPASAQIDAGCTIVSNGTVNELVMFSGMSAMVAARYVIRGEMTSADGVSEFIFSVSVAKLSGSVLQISFVSESGSTVTLDSNLSADAYVKNTLGSTVRLQCVTNAGDNMARLVLRRSGGSVTHTIYDVSIRSMPA